ncbi:MAG: D-alanine--D-alanine ligase family protein [Candidatus Dormibacteria bacterium]
MITVGVFFGGRSVEHEVSVITAMQTMAAFPGDRVTAVPVYIAKTGAWYSGDELRTLDAFRDVARLVERATRVRLRGDPTVGGATIEAEPRRGFMGGGTRDIAHIDVAMPLVHGSNGEDGTLQGLFELIDVAYCGSGVAASAVSMDKRLAKAAFRAAGLAVVDDIVLARERWRDDGDTVITEVERGFAYPLFVKPMSLGSSIGVSRVEDATQLRAAIELALTYDTRCLVEPAQEDIVEINCAVLGRGDDLRVSACEQPKASGLLTYEDKYLSKGAKAPDAGGKVGSQRIVPAPLSGTMTHLVQAAAKSAFSAIGAEGVARVDFLVRPDREEIIVNEINTVPGSLSFYLWEPAGLSFPELVGTLVDLALTRHEVKSRTVSSIDTWLLTGTPRS